MGHGELSGDRLSDDDRPGRAEIPYHLRVVLRDASRVQSTASLGWSAGRVEDVLYADRYAHERPRRACRDERCVHEHRVLSFEVDERMQPPFRLPEPPDAGLDRGAHAPMMLRAGQRLLTRSFAWPARRRTRSSRSSANQSRSQFRSRSAMRTIVAAIATSSSASSSTSDAASDSPTPVAARRSAAAMLITAD